MKRNFRTVVSSAAALLAGFAALSVHAQTTYNWRGSTDTNWNNAANWNSPGVPPSGVTNFGRVTVTNHPTLGFPLYYTASQGVTVFTNGGSGTPRALVIGSPAGTWGTMVISGGTWESRGTSPDVIANAGGVGVLTVDGGNYVFTNAGSRTLLMPLSASPATLNIISGSAMVDTINFGQDAGSIGSGTMNLNGGTLGVKTLNRNGTVAATNNFNGGTLLALGSGTLVNVDNNNILAGLRVDSQAFNVSIPRPLLHAGAGTDGGLVKSGSGALILTATNTFNGGVTVNAGTIVFATNGLGSGSIAFAASGGLKWTNGNTEDISIRLAPVPVGATVTFDDGGSTIAFATPLSGSGGIGKSGNGTLILALANPYNGQTTVNGGGLRVANNGALGTTANGTVVNGGHIELADGITVSGEAITVNGDGGNNVGALQTIPGAHAVWAGPVLVSGVNTRMGAQSNATLEVAGSISGSVPLAIRNGFTAGLNDAGTVIFSAPNTFTAELLLVGGNLRLAGGDDRLPAGNRVWFGSNTLSATLDLNGTSPQLGGVAVASTSTGVQIIGNSSTTADATLTLGFGGGANTTNTFTGIITDLLAGGTHKVNVSVVGGETTLTGTNTYSGFTRVSNGKLILTPAYAGGGAFEIADSGVLAFNVTSANGTLVGSDLASTGAGTKSIDYNLSVSGNPAAALIRATNLVLNGTLVLNFSGFGLSVGSIHLIDYDTISGSGNIVTGALPAGVVAHIETNAAQSSIDLVLDQVPSLLWLGEVGGVPSTTWDVGITMDWLDKTTLQPSVFLNTLDVTFDDSITNVSGTNWITLVTNVHPALLMVSNNAVNYTFSNAGTSNVIDGNARLVKEGAGVLTLAVSNNTYSGPTLLNAGVLQLGATAALAPTPLTNQALLDLAGFSVAPGSLSGTGVITNTSAVSVTNRVALGNNNWSGDFSGRIDDGPQGKVELAKFGNGLQVLRNASSTYSGGTTIGGGAVRLAADNVLGIGSISLSNATLTSEASAPRTLTNALTISGNSSLGDTQNNGPLFITGPLDFAGGARNITDNAPVVYTGNSVVAAGGLNFKLGLEPFTLRSNTVTWVSAVEVQAGSLIVEGARWTNAGSIRTVATLANGVATLLITNGGAVVITSSVAVVRGGNAGSGGSATGTNVFNIAGSLLLPFPGTAATDGKVLLGRGCARAIVNLLSGGLLLARNIERDPSDIGVHDAEFNFDGGTLKPSTGSSAATFMQGLTEAKVRAGGAVIDTAGFNITIGQSLLQDPASTGGGLTKLGGGTLFLNGTNSYAGLTLVSEGALGGTGLLSGPVSIAAGAAIAPGNGIGTLTISNSLTLTGVTRIEVNRTNVQNSDKIIGLTSLNRGGLLEISNAGPALQPGDSFDVFSAAVLAGAFTAISPASPNGDPALAWDTNQLALGRLVVQSSPIAIGDTAGAILGGSVEIPAGKLLANDSDPDGDLLAVVAVTSPSANGGTVTLTSSNTVLYVAPSAGIADTFSYTISDGRGGTASASVAVSLVAGGEGFNRVGIETLGNGDVKLSYAGIPGYHYALDWTHSLSEPITWTPVTTNQANAQGSLLFTNSPSGGSDFYRTRYVP